jgi:hypothetical protein
MPHPEHRGASAHRDNEQTSWEAGRPAIGGRERASCSAGACSPFIQETMAIDER